MTPPVPAQNPPDNATLNVEVAARVMGWRRLTYREAFPWWCDDGERDGADDLTGDWHGPKDADGESPAVHPVADGYEGVEGFFPSERIGIAWLVVEQMREKGWYFEWSDGAYGVGTAAFWTASSRYRRGHRCKADDKSAPLAICRAALLALSKEPQDA